MFCQASTFISQVATKHDEVDISETMLVVFVFFFLWQTSDIVFSKQFVRESETIEKFFSKTE